MTRLENLRDILSNPMRQANLAPERLADLRTLVDVAEAAQAVSVAFMSDASGDDWWRPIIRLNEAVEPLEEELQW